MFETLKRMLGMGPKVDLLTLHNAGAIIIDVRMPNEFIEGHIHGSRNIPLSLLLKQCEDVNKSTVMITCCASGMRSATAKRMLETNGFTNVHNGGGWKQLQLKLK
jgi:rhodanese-related sulfurtransferase